MSAAKQSKADRIDVDRTAAVRGPVGQEFGKRGACLEPGKPHRSAHGLATMRSGPAKTDHIGAGRTAGGPLYRTRAEMSRWSSGFSRLLAGIAA